MVVLFLPCYLHHVPKGKVPPVSGRWQLSSSTERTWVQTKCSRGAVDLLRPVTSLCHHVTCVFMVQRLECFFGNRCGGFLSGLRAGPIASPDFGSAWRQKVRSRSLLRVTGTRAEYMLSSASKRAVYKAFPAATCLDVVIWGLRLKQKKRLCSVCYLS